MAAIPYMPLYVADYLSDAAHLSTLEHGAYLLLIMTYWQRGECLPADDKKLARICRIGPREWSRIKPVISEFFQVDCNNWSHRRIESELHNVRAKSLKKREGGLARAKQMHSNRSARAQQSDTDTDTEGSVDKSTDALRPPIDLADQRFWRDARAYVATSAALKGRDPGSMIGKWIKTHGKPNTATAITQAQIERAADPLTYVEGYFRRSAQPAMMEAPC